MSRRFCETWDKRSRPLGDLTTTTRVEAGDSPAQARRKLAASLGKFWMAQRFQRCDNAVSYIGFLAAEASVSFRSGSILHAEHTLRLSS